MYQVFKSAKRRRLPALVLVGFLAGMSGVLGQGLSALRGQCSAFVCLRPIVRRSCAFADTAGGRVGPGVCAAAQDGSERPMEKVEVAKQKQERSKVEKGGAARQEAKKRPPRGSNLLIVGLGNPGDKYKMTRHNAGFLVVDEVARRIGADMKLRSAFQGEYGSASLQGKSIGLLKPITFMNNSGQSVRKVLDYFKLPLSAVLVVVDEVALELGQVRLRATGSAGGHNGLKSIESHVKSRDYARLRVGIGAAGPRQLVDHVLGEFGRSERGKLGDVMCDSCDAIEQWIANEEIEKVMSAINAPKG